MAGYNLLPWREAELQRENKRLLSLSIAIWLACALGAIYAVYLLNSRLDNQNARNDYLTSKIKFLDSQITDIKKLKEQKKDLIGRIEVIQGLQQDRMQIVHVLDDIVHKTPSGTTLDSLIKNKKLIHLNGRAQANSRVSEFMKQLDTSQRFGEATLTEIDIKESDKNRLSTFNVTVSEKIKNNPSKSNSTKVN